MNFKGRLMNSSALIDSELSRSYLEPLLNGDRTACRTVIENALNSGSEAYVLLTQLIWPTMELLQSLYREDRISITSLNLATRLNRCADRSAERSPGSPRSQWPQGPDLLRQR